MLPVASLLLVPPSFLLFEIRFEVFRWASVVAHVDFLPVDHFDTRLAVAVAVFSSALLAPVAFVTFVLVVVVASILVLLLTLALLKKLWVIFD
jgi:hypothetical protein